MRTSTVGLSLFFLTTLVFSSLRAFQDGTKALKERSCSLTDAIDLVVPGEGDELLLFKKKEDAELKGVTYYLYKLGLEEKRVSLIKELSLSAPISAAQQYNFVLSIQDKNNQTTWLSLKTTQQRTINDQLHYISCKKRIGNLLITPFSTRDFHDNWICIDTGGELGSYMAFHVNSKDLKMKRYFSGSFVVPFSTIKRWRTFCYGNINRGLALLLKNKPNQIQLYGLDWKKGMCFLQTIKEPGVTAIYDFAPLYDSRPFNNHKCFYIFPSKVKMADPQKGEYTMHSNFKRSCAYSQDYAYAAIIQTYDKKDRTKGNKILVVNGQTGVIEKRLYFPYHETPARLDMDFTQDNKFLMLLNKDEKKVKWFSLQQ